MSKMTVENEVSLSVVTVCFNSGKTIGRTLKSVFDSATNFVGSIELVIIDGCSTDNTIEIVNSYIKASPDNISIKFVSEPDKGIYDAMNKGVNLSSGNVIGFLNSDDMFLPFTIKTIVEAFNGECDVSAIHADVLWEYDLDKENVLVRRNGSPDLSALTTGMTINHPTLYCKRSLYSKLGLFDTNLRYVADWKWAIGLLNYSGNIKYLNIPLVVFNMGGVSNQLIGRRIMEILSIYNNLRKDKNICLFDFFSLCRRTLSKTIFSMVYTATIPAFVRKKIMLFRKLKLSVSLKDFRGEF